MKKIACILFLSMIFLFLNHAHANFIQTLKEKRSIAIEKLHTRPKRILKLENDKEEMEKYLNSNLFYFRKIIFLFSLGSLWIFVWSYAIIKRKI